MNYVVHITEAERASLESRVAEADARIAAQQHQGARYEATTEHPVQFAITAGQAPQGTFTHRRNRFGTLGSTGPLRPVVSHGRQGPAAAAIRPRYGLFDQGIPAAAARTTAKKLAGLGATALADVNGDGSGQGRSRTDFYEERWL